MERVSKLMCSNKLVLIITSKYTPDLDEMIIQAPASSDFVSGAESCRSIDFISQNEKF